MTRTRRALLGADSIRVARPGPEGGVVRVVFEDYVSAAVVAETTADWEPAALEAQTVACRSYALHALRHPRAATHDVWAGTLDQAVDSRADVPEPVRRALVRTEGRVLTTRSFPFGPRPLKALFHHSCGGHTDLPRTVWPRERLRGHGSVSCARCGRSPFRWTVTLSASELLEALDLPAASAAGATIESVQRAPSGRLQRLRIGSGARSTEITGDRLRAAVGYERLPSACFDWDLDDGVRLIGVGSGHGVGLCQAGARAMAADGADPEQILAHYYPTADLVAQ